MDLHRRRTGRSAHIILKDQRGRGLVECWSCWSEAVAFAPAVSSAVLTWEMRQFPLEYVILPA